MIGMLITITCLYVGELSPFKMPYRKFGPDVLSYHISVQRLRKTGVLLSSKAR